MNREDRVNRLGAYWRRKYGKKVYKIIVSGKFTCPNIDGSKGEHGCIFCNMSALKTATAEEHGKNDALMNQKYMVTRNKAEAFYAYFQDFSATYPNADVTNKLTYLRKIYTEAAALDNVVGISIGTRCDTIDKDVLDMLKEIDKDVVLEIGLQTIVKEDSEWMRRGHTLADYEEKVKLIQSYGFEVVSHIIIGLPHETDESLLATAHYLNKLKISGVKFHQLMVLKDADLEEEYKAGRVKVLSQEEYLKKVTLFLTHLDKDVVVHRMYGDAPKKDLIAPLWCENKTQVQDIILNYMVEKDLWQGCKLNC